MGSGHTKDGFIDIFLETTQPIYTAGTYVDGTVYINCKASRDYRMLNLKLDGIEHVHWSQGSGKNRRTYNNTKQTYHANLQLAVFANNVIPAGNYSFPFRFLLPAQLPGSMFQSQNNYIRYPLTAQLISADQKNDNQLYVKHLNVLQPLRQLSGMIQKQQTTNPQCCGCCKDYGMVKVVMTCDKNQVRTGQKIHVSGYIDNTAGKTTISTAHVSFQDIRWRISSSGAVRRNILLDHPLFVIPEEIQPGSAKQFSFSATVPGGMLFSTAIGSIVARYQVLNFSCNMGCCANDPTCQFLMVFHSDTQQIEVSPQVPPPAGWNPVVANEVLCTTFPPYHYQPTLGIPYMNRTGVSNTVQMNAMNTEQGCYPHPNGFDNNTLVQMG